MMQSNVAVMNGEITVDLTRTFLRLFDLADGRIIMTFFVCVLILIVLSIPAAYLVGLSYGKGFFRRKMEHFKNVFNECSDEEQVHRDME